MTSSVLGCVRLELAGSGDYISSISIPRCWADIKTRQYYTWTDLQSTVYEHVKAAFGQGSTSLDVRIFDEHNGPELTAVAFEDTTTSFRHWWSWLQKLKSSCVRDTSYVLSIAKYAEYDRIRSDILCNDNYLRQYAAKLDAQPAMYKQLVIDVVSRDGRSLERAGTFQDDFDVVHAAVKQNGLALVDASQKLRSSKNLLLLALETYDILNTSHWHVRVDAGLHHELYDCDDFALQAVKVRGTSVAYFSRRIQATREIALCAVRQSWRALALLDAFWSDKQLVLEAVKGSTLALQYVDPVLAEDPDIHALMFAHGYSMSFAGEDQLQNQSFVLDQVGKRGLNLEFCTHADKANRVIVLAAVQQDGKAFEYADESLRKDMSTVVKACEQDPSALIFSLIKHERDFVRAQVAKCSSAMKWIYTEAGQRYLERDQ